MNQAPADFLELFRQAQNAHRSGQINQATSLYQRLIQIHPTQAEPYHMMALIQSNQGEYQQAVQLFDKAISLNPDNPVYRNNIAEALQRFGQERLAIQHLHHALTLDPSFYIAKQKLASILKKLHQFDQAETLFHEVISQKPDFEPAYFQLGTLILQTGQYRKAIEYLRKSTELDSASHKSYNNLAVCHQELEEFDLAIAYYQKALEVDPAYTDSLRNMALILDKQGEPQSAKTYYRRLAKVKGNDPLILWVAELVSSPVFHSNEEIDNYRIRIINELRTIKSRKIQIDVDELVKLDIHPPSSTIYQGRDDLPLKMDYADLFKGIPKLQLSNQKTHKPHVGFVVTHGHEGVFIKCMLGLLNNLSTEKFKITVVCSLPNGAKIIQPKVINSEIQFLSLPKSLGESIKILVSANIDFLHYWEVGTDAYNYFIPFFKPARFQATSWGWPVTSGNPNIDYFISSKELDNEESQAHYSERLVLFKKLPLYYYHQPLPDFNKKRSDFGLDDGVKIYSCIQNVRKVHPDMDQLVKGILEKDKKAVVVFTGDKFKKIASRLEERFEKTLDKYLDRIKVLPRLDHGDYFNLIKLSDVILDTVHYTGGANTNYDAFQVGTPVVTWPGTYHRSKYTAAAYRQMGIEELIADSDAAYIALAFRVANDHEYRKSISEKIRINQNKIFEDIEAVSELENFIYKLCS